MSHIGNLGHSAILLPASLVLFCFLLWLGRRADALAFLAALSVYSTAFAVLVLVILAVTLCTTALAQATLSGLYSAALYRYAAGETKTGDIDPALLQSAFRARG